jgi:hypothetical protein
MDFLIYILLFVIIFILYLFLSSYGIVSWDAHEFMTKKYSDKYIYSSYKTFKETFLKYEWDFCSEGDFSVGLINEQYNCLIQNNIIKFDGIGMIMRSRIELSLAKSLVQQHIYHEYGYLYDEYGHITFDKKTSINF